MGVVLTKVVAALVMPPAGNLLLLAFAAIAWRRFRRLAGSAAILSVASLYLLSLPVVGNALERTVIVHHALDLDGPEAARAGAILLLAGGRHPSAPEYGGETVSKWSLVRARYAARLHRVTGLPVLVSGGSVFDEPVAEAELIADLLEHELGVVPRWVESRSRNTAENARLSAEILAREGIDTVLLVTNAAHMTRAEREVRRAGLTPVPAPTDFDQVWTQGPVLLRWVPNAHTLSDVTAVLHEHLGRLWYRLRY